MYQFSTSFYTGFRCKCNNKFNKIKKINALFSHFKQTLAFPSPYLPSFTALCKKNELSDVSSIQIEMHTRVYIQEMYKETASMYYGFGLHVTYSPIFVQTPCCTYNSHLFTVSY